LQRGQDPRAFLGRTVRRYDRFDQSAAASRERAG
jgi:hypothetical protein